METPGPAGAAVEIASELVRYARALVSHGLVSGSSGNISIRATGTRADGAADDETGEDGEELLWVTPSALAYEEMTAADCVAVALASGAVRVGTRRPSSETPMHRAVYLARPDVRAIVHTHSLYATMFAIANEPVPPVHYVLAEIGDSVPVAPYAPYGSQELAQAAVATLGRDGHGILLRNHGVLAVGPDLATAFRRAETIETVAHLAWGARLLGPVTPLTPAQMAEARARFATYFTA